MRYFLPGSTPYYSSSEPYGLCGLSFSIGGSDFGIPSWLTERFDVPLPSTDQLKGYFTEQIQEIGGSAVGQVSGLIGAAAAAAGPLYGTMIAGAAKVLSVFASMFGDEPDLIPPRPRIAGEDANEVFRSPFGHYGRAIAVGRGYRNGNDPDLDGRIYDIFLNVLAELDSGKSFAQTDVAIRGLYRDVGLWSNPTASVAYFVAACNYDKLFSGDRIVEGYARQIGKLLAFGSPRLRLRSLITSYVYYLRAKAVEEFGAEYNVDIRDEDESLQPSSKWRQRTITIAAPIPSQAGDMWVYQPWDRTFVSGQIKDVYVPGAELRDFVAKSQGSSFLITVKRPGVLFGWKMGNETKYVRSESDYAQDVASAFRLALGDVGHTRVVQSVLATMRADINKRRKEPVNVHEQARRRARERVAAHTAATQAGVGTLVGAGGVLVGVYAVGKLLSKRRKNPRKRSR